MYVCVCVSNLGDRSISVYVPNLGDKSLYTHASNFDAKSLYIFIYIYICVSNFLCMIDTEHIRALYKTRAAIPSRDSDAREDATATAAREDATATAAREDATATAAREDATATARGFTQAVMIKSESVKISAGLTEAVLDATRTACNHMELWNPTHNSVYLRYMLLCCGPTETSGDQRPTESINLNYPQPPVAFARMVVQIPCEYTASERGTASARVNSSTKTVKFDTHSDDSFHYFFAYSLSDVRIHAPSRGCGVFLVFDVFTMARIYINNISDNYAAEDILAKCVQFWEDDPQCEKLAVALVDPLAILCTRNKKISFDHITNVRDRVLIRTLLRCEALDVGLMGESMYVCMYVCMPVCRC
jgi:hypothetical protein